jgi:hypothetical protein
MTKMTAEKKQKIADLRKRLSGITEIEKSRLISKGTVTTIEGHVLSVRNTMLCYFQFANPTVVGGFQQWRKAGRTVRKGEHGMAIFTPCHTKSDDGSDETYFITSTVFDITQTDTIDGTQKEESWQ